MAIILESLILFLQQIEQQQISLSALYLGAISRKCSLVNIKYENPKMKIKYNIDIKYKIKCIIKVFIYSNSWKKIKVKGTKRDALLVVLIFVLLF